MAVRTTTPSSSAPTSINVTNIIIFVAFVVASIASDFRRPVIPDAADQPFVTLLLLVLLTTFLSCVGSDDGDDGGQ